MSEVITSTINSQSEEMFQNKLLSSMLENERKRICGVIGTTADNTCPGYVSCPHRIDLESRNAQCHCLLKLAASRMQGAEREEDGQEVQHEQI